MHPHLILFYNLIKTFILLYLSLFFFVTWVDNDWWNNYHTSLYHMFFFQTSSILFLLTCCFCAYLRWEYWPMIHLGLLSNNIENHYLCMYNVCCNEICQLFIKIENKCCIFRVHDNVNNIFYIFYILFFIF